MTTRSVRFLRLLLTAVILLGAPVAAAGQESDGKLDRALRTVRSGGPQRVIIRATDSAARAELRAALRAHGDKVEAEHPSIDALTVEVHGDDLAALAARADVLSVALDAEVAPTGDWKKDKKKARRWAAGIPSNVLRDTLGLARHSADGRGIGVALIDSGIASVPGLKGRIVAFYDFTNGRIVATAPRDSYGHGTHVAGLIGGAHARKGWHYEGVAPGVHFVGLKVLDQEGRGRTSDVIRAIEFATANRDLFNIHIINLSLGHPIFQRAADDPLVQAVETATRAGLVVMVSAGNIGMSRETGDVGYAGITSPGNAPSAITVGAVDTNGTSTRSDDEVTAYSSRGPSWYDAFAKPNLVAPGHALVASVDSSSTLFKKYPMLRRGKDLLSLSGTSMATGVTTGVAAVLLDESKRANGGENPRLAPNAVKALLQFTAIPLRDPNGQLYDGLTQGTGAVNASGALRLAGAINTGAAVNAAWADDSILHVSSIAGEELPWASNILWGENILWGDSVFANQPAWAANIVWGDEAFTGTAWAVNVHWAENIVWSMADDNIVWAENIVWGEGLLRAASDDNIVWSMVTSDDNIVWSMVTSGDNIVWSNLFDDNIVWGYFDDNIVWSMHGSLW